MEESTMIVQIAWQNALYINVIEYSIIYHYKSYWSFSQKYFDNNAQNLENMAIVNAREL